MNEYKIIESLFHFHNVSADELKTLILCENESVMEQLYATARQVQHTWYGNQIYIRGLIEFTNCCRNDCYYCGIRRSNPCIKRYRLSTEEILQCCELGYQSGFRTFVLQGGEDAGFGCETMTRLIAKIHEKYPDCAITLSFGEWEKEVYQQWFDAGATRYLLRHETATKHHYEMLHPKEMSFMHRMNCLYMLKEIGYQTGAGFMVGSPGQQIDEVVSDLCFLKEFQPHMIGIGPFISQKDTPFHNASNGSAELTVKLLAILRLLLPKVLLPATTALGTISNHGREQGILAGANVVMPNLSPIENRKQYALYDHKLGEGVEAVEGLQLLKQQMHSIGYEVVTDIGDSRMLIDKIKMR